MYHEAIHMFMGINAKKDLTKCSHGYIFFLNMGKCKIFKQLVKTAVSLHSNFLHHASLGVVWSWGGYSYSGALAERKLKLGVLLGL